MNIKTGFLIFQKSSKQNGKALWYMFLKIVFENQLFKKWNQVGERKRKCNGEGLVFINEKKKFFIW